MATLMRVAHVVYEPAHSGQSVHVLSLAERLDRARVALWVCYPAGDERMRDALARLGVEGRPWPMRRWQNVGPALALSRLVRQEHIQIVHVHGPFAGLWARPAARWAGARVIYTPQTVQIRQRRLAPIYRALERTLGRLTDRVVSVCEADRRRLIEWRWAAPQRIVTIPNGIDTAWWAAQPRQRSEARQRLGWPADAPIVVQIGRLDAQKAPDQLVRAAMLVRKDIPHARFYLAGDGPLRPALEAQIAAIGLADAIVLLGQRNDVPALLAAADVISLTSLWEGMPYVLLEAGAVGRPAVCTAVNGSPEVVLDGVTGYVVPPADAPALAAALVRLLRQPDLAEHMGTRARQRVLTYFDAGATAAAVQALYEDVLGAAQGIR
jgi:glycosyltransferase involved in cell wall biosynthesis